jgi:uncharacterized protein (DUF1800 family)
MALSAEHARLNLPPDLAFPPRLEPPSFEAAEERAAPRAAVRRASRRSWLTAFSGGTGVSSDPQLARRDPLLILMHRITYGFSLPEYERAKTLGFQGYLDEQLDHLAIDDAEMTDFLRINYSVTEMSPREVYDNYNALPVMALELTKGALLARAVASRRQLYERLCEFWIDHFNVDHNKGLLWLLVPEFERTVIRPHALGSFPAMLTACAFSGAMLYYLDNWLNVREAPQENYARELLELHTLGVHGGYNEGDVDEVAKCFTGWTLIGDNTSPDWLRGTFDPSLHTGGRKFVLGHDIPDTPIFAKPGDLGGYSDAKRVLDIVSEHPSTADFLARKLLRRFLTPTPPEELVARVREAYLTTGGDIRAMLRVILTQENLVAHTAVAAPKYRRPFHYMASVVRAVDGFVPRPSNPLQYLVQMGHAPYDFELPTGYPDDFESWGGALQPRWVFPAMFFRYDRPFRGIHQMTAAALAARIGYAGAADRPGLAERINERLFGSALSGREVGLLQEFMDTYPAAFDFTALYDTLVLATSMPGFQWH